MAYFEGTGTGHLAVNESNTNFSVDKSRSATAWLKLVHATKQWSQAYQQAYNRIAEK